MDDAPQYDATLGGNVQLPKEITLAKFGAARAKEIEVMKKSLASSSGVKLAFQKIPKHMRRRVMSHNAKRLPRRLREIHMNQMKKSGLPPKQKRPSRKYRRKPYNLTKEYTRRQAKVTWLYTHIWHAKRFHMIEKWGHKLPLKPCDKAFRACYRASTKHCLLEDISYHKCIEISGDMNCIINSFKTITDIDVGLSIGAKSFIDGNREGNITLFEFGMLPKRAIGSVYFQWRPCSSEDINRALWLWVHAAFYSEALETLIKCLNLQETIGYHSADVDVKLFERRTELCRFRLTGPLANSTVQNCLKPCDLSHAADIDWFQTYSTLNKDVIAAQNNLWNDLKNITSVSELSPHIIFSVIVHDPRFSLPKTRTKSVPEVSIGNLSSTFGDVSASPLWNNETRKLVDSSKITNNQIAEFRNELLVPGSDIYNHGVPVPVILIQRPGSRFDNLGYCSGWDIILSSAWAQSFWISLIMWGARAGGLRESESTTFELNKSNFLYPDTMAGKFEEQNISDKCKKLFFKRPPNKRTNFNKFMVVSPFEWNWNLLIKDWSNSKIDFENFHVLRNLNTLKILQQFLNCKKSTAADLEVPVNCLVPIRITCLKRGKPKDFALICFPNPADLKCEPIEPNCQDSNEALRKDLRSKHKCLLKKLRRRRHKAKMSGKPMKDVDSEELKSYTSKMRALWLPSPTTIRQSCSREVIGFVRTGAFSFTLGNGKAVGYIAGGAWNTLLGRSSRNKVLIRNTDSRQYRLATLNIIFD